MAAGTGAVLAVEEIAKHEWRFVFAHGDAAEEQFDEALESLWAGDLATAERMLQPLVTDFPDFIDARHHLAIVHDEFRRPARALREWNQAVAIGLEVIPPGFVFGRDRLEWGWLTNRPFLRAYAALGIAHRRRGMNGEAYTIFENVLDLNPNDNQGVRNPAIGCLFSLRRPQRVLDLCDRFEYGDDSVLFGRALALHQLGRKKEARAAASAAATDYPLIAQELLKKRHTLPPQAMPGYVTLGGADQAYFHWREFGRFWERSPGALDLLKPSGKAGA